MIFSALLVSKKSACPYSSESERKARYEPWTDRYDDVEDRYYCKGKLFIENRKDISLNKLPL